MDLNHTEDQLITQQSWRHAAAGNDDVSSSPSSSRSLSPAGSILAQSLVLAAGGRGYYYYYCNEEQQQQGEEAAAEQVTDAQRTCVHVTEGDQGWYVRVREGYQSPSSLGPGAGFPGTLGLDVLPNELLLQIMGFLDVNDLFSMSRTSHHLRSVSLTPILHIWRLRRARYVLPPLLWSPERPTLANLISRSIILTPTNVVSRRLARSLVSIRLSRRLACRPPASALVERAVLPKECVPGMVPVHVAPSIVQRRRDIERERIKDGLRRWIEGKWRGEVREREESQRRWEESRGVGRVWRLRRFWERIGKGEELAVR